MVNLLEVVPLSKRWFSSPVQEGDSLRIGLWFGEAEAAGLNDVLRCYRKVEGKGFAMSRGKREACAPPVGSVGLDMPIRSTGATIPSCDDDLDVGPQSGTPYSVIRAHHET